MALHRELRDAERLGDLAVALTHRGEPEHLELACGQCARTLPRAFALVQAVERLDHQRRQVAGQRLLLTLGARIPAAVAAAKAVADEDVASFAPGLALASARHETQYTRLFRS